MSQKWLSWKNKSTVTRYGQTPRIMGYATTNGIRSTSCNTLSSLEIRDVGTTSCIDEILEKYDAYICALARKNVHSTHMRIHPLLLEDQANELAQRSRIKLWQGFIDRFAKSCL